MSRNTHIVPIYVTTFSLLNHHRRNPATMARINFLLVTQIIIFSLLSSFTTPLVFGERENEAYARTLDRELLGLKKEKLSHFRLYWQDVLSGKNPSSVQIVPSPSNLSLTGFGLVRMIDNPLTQGPEVGSKLVGRAQGFYASASQQEVGLLMVMNFAFLEGKYNGSGISVLGRNCVFNSVREMPVIGGSGLFRFARGYVQARTHRLDFKTGDATVEYHIYVLHY